MEARLGLCTTKVRWGLAGQVWPAWGSGEGGGRAGGRWIVAEGGQGEAGPWGGAWSAGLALLLGDNPCPQPGQLFTGLLEFAGTDLDWAGWGLSWGKEKLSS